jgi:hypothetical protein
LATLKCDSGDVTFRSYASDGKACTLKYAISSGHALGCSPALGTTTIVGISAGAVALLVWACWCCRKRRKTMQQKAASHYEMKASHSSYHMMRDDEPSSRGASSAPMQASAVPVYSASAAPSQAPAATYSVEFGVGPLGVRFEARFGQIVVSSASGQAVLRTSASGQHVACGDCICSVAGRDVTGMSTADVANIIRASARPVVLEFSRPATTPVHDAPMQASAAPVYLPPAADAADDQYEATSVQAPSLPQRTLRSGNVGKYVPGTQLRAGPNEGWTVESVHADQGSSGPGAVALVLRPTVDDESSWGMTSVAAASAAQTHSGPAPASAPEESSESSAALRQAPGTVGDSAALRKQGGAAALVGHRGFCGECGAPSTGTKFCEGCGAKVE